MIKNPPRVMMAATASSSGKTTITCALLRAFQNRGLHPTSFKCGPDYVDPMFHREVLGVPSRNLDIFLSSENTVRYLLCKNIGKTSSNILDLSILEGVMGYYDGIAMTSQSSSFHIAKITKTPVILIINAQGMSVSIAAQLHGFLNYVPDSGIKGVIFNRLSPSLYPELKDLVERQFPVKCLGYFPIMPNCELKSRQLGLVPAKELDNLQSILDTLAQQAEKTIQIDLLLQLAGYATPLKYTAPEIPRCLNMPVSIGVAMDSAFCFYYEDNLNLLKELGANFVPFSPINENSLPDNLDGLLLGGGYPEVFAQSLSQNHSMRKSIFDSLKKGMPCIAECGGFQYLQQSIEGKDGIVWDMVKFLHSKSYFTNGLRRFGYTTLTANHNTILCDKGDSFPAHEFHHWDSTDPGDTFSARKPFRETSWSCVVSEGNLFAGYPHLYFYSKPSMAGNFLKQCALYSEEKKKAIQ